MTAVPRRVALLAVLLLGATAGVGVAAVHSRTTGCALPAPVPSLTNQLRSLGDFDQPYPAGDQRVLVDAASRVAATVHPDLAGTQPQSPVREQAATAAQPDAIVIPLVATSAGRVGPAPVVGLVSFLTDCGGQAWYHDVLDLRSGGVAPTATAFPAVTAADAARALGGTAAPQLVYTSSPWRPSWRDTASSRTVDAEPGAEGG